MGHCFTGTAYPALQLFATDTEKGQIHWLEQADGEMGDQTWGHRPVFAPWHCLVTTKRGEEPTYFRAVAPITIGTDEVMVFAVDKEARLWALRRDLTNAQVWNATKIEHNGKLLHVKEVANNKLVQLVPGSTPDGRPQLFLTGHLQGEADEWIWRVSLDNEIWTTERITGE